jgi:hypothetical protein
MNISKTLICLTTVSLAALSVPSYGQDIIPTRVPLSDIDCDFPNIGPLQPVPCLTAPGSARTVEYTNTTRTPVNATIDRVTNFYTVTYDGNLLVDGIPVVIGPVPAGTIPSFPALRDAQFYFDNGAQTVNLSTTYVGSRIFNIANTAVNPSTTYNGQYFNRYTEFNNTVRSINVQQNGTVDTLDGGAYAFTLNSLDPSAIIGGNSVALGGAFHGNSGSGALQYGRLAGTATLLNGFQPTNYPDFSGAVSTGLISPFALDYSVSTIITTQLDETGLITPTISVTNGINMNGSTITNLADAVNSGDAVNLSQLDAVGTTANTALANAATAQATADIGVAAAGAAQGTANTALANAATAQGTANSALSNAATAQGTANTALTNAATAQTTANTALANSAAATTNAAAAQGTANTALANASTAQTTANTALTNAATAQGTANAAQTNAAAAQATANSAITRADAAQGTANTALTNAAAAQTTANSAITRADAAQTTANQARTDVASVVTTSSNALVAATAAQTSASTALVNSNRAIAENHNKIRA